MMAKIQVRNLTIENFFTLMIGLFLECLAFLESKSHEMPCTKEHLWDLIHDLNA